MVYYDHTTKIRFNIIFKLLVQIRSIITESRHGNVFGEIKGGELALEGFLIEIPQPLDSPEMDSLYWDNKCGIRQDLTTYSIPFAELRQNHSFENRFRNIYGILVQRYQDFQGSSGHQVFRRVGLGSFIQYPHQGDVWAQLYDLSHPELYGQALTIV